MDSDTLALLEEKIQKTVEVFAALRNEKEAAIASSAEVPALRTRIAELTRELESIRAERDALRADKETVRQRVQKLLEHIDTLNAG